jgi:hypothetical protein
LKIGRWTGETLSERLEGGNIMKWEPPSFMEIKMDAEINAYQDDFADISDVQEPSTEPPITSPRRINDR